MASLNANISIIWVQINLNNTYITLYPKEVMLSILCLNLQRLSYFEALKISISTPLGTFLLFWRFRIRQWPEIKALKNKISYSNIKDYREWSYIAIDALSIEKWMIAWRKLRVMRCVFFSKVYERRFRLIFEIICVINLQPNTASRVKFKENDTKTIRKRYYNLPSVRWIEKSFKFSCYKA